MGRKYKSGGLGFDCELRNTGSRWKWTVFSHGTMFASGTAGTKKGAKKAVAEAKERLRAGSRTYLPGIYADDAEIRRLRILPLARLPRRWHREVGQGDDVLLRTRRWYKQTSQRKTVARRFDLAGSSLVSLV